MCVVVGLEVNQIVTINESLENFVFLCEVALSSPLIWKGSDEIEITTKDINRNVLVLNKPLEEIKKGIFLIRELGSIDISYTTMNIGANEVKEGSDRMERSQESIKYHLCWISRD